MTEKCENCRNEFPKSKIQLHKSFCLKNNKYCPTCSKVFLKTEFEEHIKTHNPLNFKKNIPPQIPEKKTITNQQNSISEHKKHCHHEKEIPKIEKRKIKVDDSLGLKQCDYCYNMFDNIEEHLKKCKAKKFIEEENAKYYESLKKRMEEDDKLANELSKEKFMDTKNDEKIALDLQNQLKPIIDTNNDEKLAKDLQSQLKPIIDTNNDEKLAKDLQSQLKPIIDTNNDEKLAKDLQRKMKPIVNTKNDEKLAKDLQRKMKPIVNTSNDEELARKLENELNFNSNNNRNLNNYEDDELKRIIEASKNDFSN